MVSRGCGLPEPVYTPRFLQVFKGLQEEFRGKRFRAWAQATLKVPRLLLVGLLSAGDPQPPPVSPHLWGRGSSPRPLHLWGCDSPQSRDWAPPGPFSCGVVTVPGPMTGPLCLWGCDNLQTPSSMGQQQPPGS